MSAEAQRTERLQKMYPDRVAIDAGTFQKQVLSLSETLLQKVKREGIGANVPAYVAEDLFVLLRLSQQCFAYLSYMNADERREGDIYWREQYSVLSLSSIRTMIDCLYNITTIIEAPVMQGRNFRLGGLKKFLLNLEEEESKYRDCAEWQMHFEQRHKLFDKIAADSGVMIDDVRASRAWPTFGTYMRECYGKETPLQAFFRLLTLGSWSDYSALLHASFEGLLPNIGYFVTDTFAHDFRPKVKEQFLPYITMHLCRSACVLLCILTEVQAHFRYDKEQTARIDARLCEIWAALTVSYEVQEFYDARYKELLVEFGIAKKGSIKTPAEMYDGAEVRDEP